LIINIGSGVGYAHMPFSGEQPYRMAGLACGHCCSSSRGSWSDQNFACTCDKPVYTYCCRIHMQFSAMQHRSRQTAACSAADALTHSHLSVSLLLLLYAGAYSASKHALHSISDILRVELAPLGVDVMLVVPGEMPSHSGSQSFV
jgi:NAD(P)-dependent dehydrogenase (short-subunit alcohol dehydrogenase family)